MTYDYLCKNGHVTEFVCLIADVHPVDKRPKRLKCGCGASARRVITSCTFGMNLNGKHGTADSTERAYGTVHADGLRNQREMSETMIALGASDGHQGEGKSSWALPTAEGVRDKQEKIKNGWKPPENHTFGIKREVLQKHGIV